MDQVSFVETARHRLRLSLQNLKLENSKCKHSEADVVKMNLEILSGEAGWDVVMSSYQLLLQEPDSLSWHPYYKLPYHDCVGMIFTTLCDSWRRLVLPYQNITYKTLCLATMDAQAGLEFLWREMQTTGQCSCCQDRYFSLVSELHMILLGLIWGLGLWSGLCVLALRWF